MTNNLTPKQKQTIQSRLDAGMPLTGTRTVRIGISLEADLVVLLEDNPDRFNDNFSRLVRDIVECYKKYGVDWRNDNNSQFEEIKRMIENLKIVAVTGDVVATGEAANSLVKKIDASGGFSE